MPIHICKTCKDQFYTEAELKSHQSKERKKKCKPREKSTKVLLPCICKCEKELSSPAKLKKHRKICPVAIKAIKTVKVDTNNNVSKGDIITIGNNSGTINANKNTTNNTTNNITNIILNNTNELIIAPHLTPYGIIRLTVDEQNELLNMDSNPPFDII